MNKKGEMERERKEGDKNRIFQSAIEENENVWERWKREKDN